MRPGHLTKCFRHGCAFRLSVLTCLAKKSTKTRRRKKKKKSVYGSSEGLVGFCLNGGLECFAKAACGWGEARRRVSLGLCLHTAAQKAWLSSHPLPETPCFHLMHFALRKKKVIERDETASTRHLVCFHTNTDLYAWALEDWWEVLALYVLGCRTDFKNFICTFVAIK